MNSSSWAEQFDTIEISLLKEDYQAVIENCTRLLQDPSIQRPGLDRIFYLRGIAYSKTQQISYAREDFQKIISEFPKSKLRLEAKLALADTYFLEGDYQTAQVEYKNLIANFPKENIAPAVLFRLAQCAQRLGNWEEAKYYFQQVQLKWQKSPEARLVEELKIGEEAFFCVQVGSFTDRNNAESLMEKLKKDYYPVYIVEIKKSGESFYRVRVGRFGIRKDAEDLAERLKLEGFPTRVCP